MNIKNRLKSIGKLGGAIAISSIAMQAAAAEVRYDLSWEGQNGYTASGYFTYDDATAGHTVLDEELSDFYLQSVNPNGVVLGEFTFEDIGKPSYIFRFTYDTLGQRILLAGETDPNGEHELDSSSMLGGFSVGNYTRTTGNVAIASRIGCNDSYPGEYLPELDLYYNSDGSCSSPMERVDQGAPGSEITVTLGQLPDSTEFHSISITIDDGQGPVPVEGGRFNYAAIIENLDDAENVLRKWSVLTLPSGEDYSIHKAKTVTISANDVKRYNRPYINIPDWFPAGEYSFTWYVADPDNVERIIIQDTFTFEKLGQ